MEGKVYKRIFFDESGNTGSDLLNPDQPVFVLASNCFSETECIELRALFNQTNELHFKKLKNSSNGRNELLGFLNHQYISEARIRCVAANKKYSTVAQIVDRLIEPVLHKSGLDIYQGGENISTTNILYALGTSGYWNQQLFDRFLTAFIKMVREKSYDSIKQFYDLLEEMYSGADQASNLLLEPIRMSQLIIDSILSNIGKFDIDVTLSSFYALCNYWYNDLNEKIVVIHDDSKQISHYLDYIDFLRSIESEPTEVGYGPKKLVFPSQINELQLASSKDENGVQFSDIIASSISFVFNNKDSKQERFVNQIGESRLFNLTNWHLIAPSENVTPESHGFSGDEGTNILDYLVEQEAKKTQDRS